METEPLVHIPVPLLSTRLPRLVHLTTSATAVVVLITSKEHVLSMEILTTEPESLESIRLQKFVQLRNQISLLSRRELVAHVDLRQEVLEPTNGGNNLVNLSQNSVRENGTLGRDENNLGGGLLLVQGINLGEEVRDSTVKKVQSSRELSRLNTVLGADGGDTIESEGERVGVSIIDKRGKLVGQGGGGLVEEEELDEDPEVFLGVQVKSDRVHLSGTGRDKELHVLGVHSESDTLIFEGFTRFEGSQDVGTRRLDGGLLSGDRVEGLVVGVPGVRQDVGGVTTGGGSDTDSSGDTVVRRHGNNQRLRGGQGQDIKQRVSARARTRAREGSGLSTLSRQPRFTNNTVLRGSDTSDQGLNVGKRVVGLVGGLDLNLLTVLEEGEGGELLENGSVDILNSNKNVGSRGIEERQDGERRTINGIEVLLIGRGRGLEKMSNQVGDIDIINGFVFGRVTEVVEEHHSRGRAKVRGGNDNITTPPLKVSTTDIRGDVLGKEKPKEGNKNQHAGFHHRSLTQQTNKQKKAQRKKTLSCGEGDFFRALSSQEKKEDFSWCPPRKTPFFSKNSGYFTIFGK